MKILQIDDLRGKLFEEHPFPFWPEYGRFSSQCLNETILLIASDDGELVIPMSLKARTLLTQGELLFPPLRNGKHLPPEEELTFLEELLVFLRHEKICHRLIQPPTYAIFQGSPRQAISCPFGSYVLRLEGRSEDDLFSKIHSKHRNVIRNAEKEVSVKWGAEQLHPFVQLYEETMNRGGMFSQGRSYFEKLFEHLGESRLMCGVVYDGEGPLGGLLAPFSRSGAFYLFGASAGQMRVTGAVNLLHWDWIRKMREARVDTIDYVGARVSPEQNSKFEGLQRFKSRFGGDLRTGVLWKMDLVPLRTRTFDVLSHGKSILRGRPRFLDIIDQERSRSA